MKNFNFKSPLLLITVICIFLLLGSVSYIFYKFNASDQTPLVGDMNVVMRVGEESIYGKDFQYELAQYPQTPDAEHIIWEKLATDSIILQGAKEDGLLSLDDSFYNSPSKDYTKRIQVISQIKRQIEDKPDAIEGYVIGVWFRNNGFVGPLGLEGSKARAYQKVTELRNQVASQKITIQQAADIIKNDASLKDLDLAYQNNAVFQFKAYRGQPKGITLSPELDTELWNLTTGEVSQVYLGKAKDPETSEIYEALYSFGQVTTVSTKGKTYQSFDDWLEGKKSIYQVVAD